jgi:hypothetical protein
MEDEKDFPQCRALIICYHCGVATCEDGGPTLTPEECWKCIEEGGGDLIEKAEI